MDDLAHRLANRSRRQRPGGGRRSSCTAPGPTAALRAADRGRARRRARCRDPRRRAAAPWTPVDGCRPAVPRLEAGVDGPGLRADAGRARRHRRAAVPRGSRSTFTLGRVRRPRRAGRCAAGDPLPVGDRGAPARRRCCRRPGARPSRHDWDDRRARSGPHAAPEFLTAAGVDELFAAPTWTVHFNSARTGVRLIGPPPRWARADGGEAGLHPSNIHDTGYAIGAVDLTGDTPGHPRAGRPEPGRVRLPAPSWRRPSAGSSASSRPVTACASCRGPRRRPPGRRADAAARWATRRRRRRAERSGRRCAAAARPRPATRRTAPGDAGR